MTEIKPILNEKEIGYKIRRIAYQIYENNVEETEILLAGISGNGFELAKMIEKELQNISDLQTTICEVNLDKKKPLGTITTSITKDEYKNKSIVLVDDVLNSGTVLIYGVAHFLDVPIKKFKTAVLVDRNHKKFPVKADFKGISLSTSLSETVDVIFEKGKNRVVLK